MGVEGLILQLTNWDLKGVEGGSQWLQYELATA
jgi:hypothetical protein